MTSWTAISQDEHKDKHWLPRKDFSNVSSMQVVEVYASEISVVPHQFSLGFVKLNEGYRLVALVGLERDKSYYVDVKGRWIGEYVPATLRCYPFIFTDHHEKEDLKVICIDQECLTDDVEAPKLFKEDGDQEDLFSEMFNFLVRCNQDRDVTQAAVNALTKADIFEAWPINVQKGGEDKVIAIEGLFRINEAKLNSLQKEEFSSLRESGAITLAYAQIFSMPQLKQLNRRFEFLALQQHQLDNDQAVADTFPAEVSLSLT